MTIEEVFSDLYDKYGEDFNWYARLLVFHAQTLDTRIPFLCA